MVLLILSFLKLKKLAIDKFVINSFKSLKFITFNFFNDCKTSNLSELLSSIKRIFSKEILSCLAILSIFLDFFSQFTLVTEKSLNLTKKLFFLKASLTFLRSFFEDIFKKIPVIYIFF